MANTKILAHHHTGRLRPHHHTSYGSLLLIVALATLPVFCMQRLASADPPPVTGTEGVYAVVPAVIPKTPAVISSPRTGQVFTTSDPVNISGSCPSNTLVKIFKNEVMSGAALCQKSTFSVPASLFVGGNSLVARSYNDNDIPGPDSQPITVQLQPPGVSVPASTLFDPTAPPVGQFYLTSDVYYRGSSPGQVASWPLTIAGGQAPYAISVKWGDGKTDLISRSSAGQLTISHIYSKAAGYQGTYTVSIKATDEEGSTTYLQLFALVPGAHKTIATTTTTNTTTITTAIQTTWRILSVIAIAVLSFWIGEKRVLLMIHRHA